MSEESQSNSPTSPQLITGGWRVAGEELPEEGAEVLVATTFVGGPFDSRRRRFKAKHITKGAFAREGTDWPLHVSPEEQGADVYHRVTHWCPLPTLPERVEEMPERGRTSGSGDKRLRRMEPDGAPQSNPSRNGPQGSNRP